MSKGLSRMARKARTAHPASETSEASVRPALMAGGGISDEVEVDGVTMRLVCGGGITLTTSDPEIIALVLKAEKARRAREAASP